jgi:hypothetical protein
VRDRFKGELTVLVRKGKEQQLTVQRQQHCRLLLEEIRYVAVNSANCRLNLWTATIGVKKTVHSPAVIGNIAIERLLAHSPFARQLEALLLVPSLSDIYQRLAFHSEDPADLNPVRGEPVKYSDLDPTITGDTTQVDVIVQELEKYLPISTLDFSTNHLLVQRYKEQEGAMTARALLRKTHAATAATEQALSNNTGTAALANKKAQKANPTTPRYKHHPKAKGGRKHPPPKPNGNKSKSARKPATTGNGSASGNKRKQPAKKQESETDDEHPQAPKKKFQKRKSQSNSNPSSQSHRPVAPQNNNATKQKTRPNQRRGNRDDANSHNKRRSKPN